MTLLAVFVIAGLYFLIFHKDPLPFNHESVGLGNLHAVHDVIGVALIGTAGLVWWRSRRAAKAKTAT